MYYKEILITGKEKLVKIKSIHPVDLNTVIISDYECPFSYPILFKQLILT